MSSVGLNSSSEVPNSPGSQAVRKPLLSNKINDAIPGKILPTVIQPQPAPKPSNGWGLRAWLPNWMGGKAELQEPVENPILQEAPKENSAPKEQAGFFSRMLGNMMPDLSIDDTNLFGETPLFENELPVKDNDLENIPQNEVILAESPDDFECAVDDDANDSETEVAFQPDELFNPQESDFNKIVEEPILVVANEDPLAPTPPMEKTDEISQGVFGKVWDGVKYAGSVAGNAFVWAAESKGGQLLAAFSGGAMMVPDQEGLIEANKAVVEAGKVIGEKTIQASVVVGEKAKEVGKVALEVLESPVGQAILEGAAAFAGGAVLVPDQEGLSEANKVVVEAGKVVGEKAIQASAVVGEKAKEVGKVALEALESPMGQAILEGAAAFAGGAAMVPDQEGLSEANKAVVEAGKVVGEKVTQASVVVGEKAKEIGKVALEALESPMGQAILEGAAAFAGGAVLSAQYKGIDEVLLPHANAYIVEPIKYVAGKPVVKNFVAGLGKAAVNKVVEKGYGQTLVWVAKKVLGTDGMTEQDILSKQTELNELVRNMKIGNYINQNVEEVRHWVGEYLESQGLPHERDDIDLYMREHAAEVRAFVADYVEATQGTEAAERLFSGNNSDLNELFVGATPKVVKLLNTYVTANGSAQQVALWNNNKVYVSEFLLWMLHAGTANLFKYMEEHPMPAVRAFAAQHGLSPIGELALYMHELINPQIADIENSIQAKIAAGTIDLENHPNHARAQITREFAPLAAKILEMAFGDPAQLSFLHRQIVSIAQGVIQENLAEHFRLGQGKPADNLMNLNREAVLAELNQKINNPAIVQVLDNTVKLIGGKFTKIAEKVAAKALTQNDQPELATFLKNNSDWKSFMAYATEVVLLRELLKRINELPEGSNLGESPADVIESVMNLFLTEFNKLDKAKIDNAFKIVDPVRRKKKLRKYFKPAVRELFSLVGSEIPIPFPSFTNELFEQTVLGQIGPDLLASIYQDWATHPQVVQKAKAQIAEVCARNHAEAAADMITAFVRDLVPNLLATEGDDMAKSILECISEQLRDLRLDAYIEEHLEETKALVTAHLNSLGRPSADANVELFMEEYESEVREMVLQKLRETNNEAVIASLQPTAGEVDNYITTNNDLIKTFISHNLEKIGDGEGIKGCMKLAAPMIKGGIMKALSGVYTHIRQLDAMKDANGRPAFMPKLILQFLNTATNHQAVINEVCIEYGQSDATNISNEEMLRAFARRNKLHKGVPATPEALKARRIKSEYESKQRKQLRKLDKAKEKLKKAKGQQTRKAAQEEVDTWRGRLKATKQVIKDADAVLNPIKEAHMATNMDGLMAFANITRPEDLPIAKNLQKPVFDIIKTKLGPKIAVEIYNKLISKHMKNKITISVLKMLQEAGAKGGLNRTVYVAPDDETQRLVDETIGNFIKRFIATLPKSATYAFLQNSHINEMTSGALGGLARQQFGRDGIFLELFEDGIQNALPALKDGTWENDAEGNPVFKPADGEMSFKFARTAEEQEEEAIKLEKEERDVSAQLRREFAKTASGQMKQLINSRRDQALESVLKRLIRFMGGEVDDALPEPGEEKEVRNHRGLWHDLQEIIDKQINDHLGGFGRHVKKFADKLCRFLFVTVAGAILKMVSPPITKGFWWVFEKIAEIKSKTIIKSLHMDVREDLCMRLFDDFIKMVNDPTGTTAQDLVAEAERKADEWTVQNEKLEKISEEQTLTHRMGQQMARIRALRDEMGRLLAEEPTKIAKMRRLARELQNQMRDRDVVPQRLLVGGVVPIESLPTGDDNISAGFRLLAPQYDAQMIAGDGHCMFRAIGTEIVRLTQAEGVSAKDRLFANVDALELDADEVAAFKSVIEELYGEEAKTPEQIMTNQIKSDLIVKVLRDTSNAYNRRNGEADLQVFLSGESETEVNMDEYYSSISDMSREDPVMGGQPELIAISRALGFSLTVLDVKLIGQGQEATTRINHEGEPKPDIALLFYSTHYNVARPKQMAEVGA